MTFAVLHLCNSQTLAADYITNTGGEFELVASFELVPEDQLNSKGIYVVEEEDHWLDFVTNETLEVLEAGSIVRNLKAGEVIFEVGDKLPGVYQLMEGEVETSRSTADGKKIIIRLIHPGATFGEVAIRSSSGSISTGRAKTDSKLKLYRVQDILRQADTDPAVFRGLYDRVVGHLDTLVQMIEATTLRSLRFRIAHRFYALATNSPNRSSNEWVVEISQSDLALAVGASRQAVNKELQYFVEQGIVRIDYNRLTIDSNKLQTILEDTGREMAGLQQSPPTAPGKR